MRDIATSRGYKRPFARLGTGAGCAPELRVMGGIITVRKVVISLLLALAVAGFGFAFASGRDPQKPTQIDPAVERTEPEPGALALRQSRIGVDILPGFTAELSIDGVIIPDDQIEKVRGLDQYWSTPGPGTETGQLAPGRHCAAVKLTKVGENGAPPETGTAKAWCFSLH